MGRYSRKSFQAEGRVSTKALTQGQVWLSVKERWWTRNQPMWGCAFQPGLHTTAGYLPKILIPWPPPRDSEEIGLRLGLGQRHFKKEMVAVVQWGMMGRDLDQGRDLGQGRGTGGSSISPSAAAPSTQDFKWLGAGPSPSQPLCGPRDALTFIAWITRSLGGSAARGLGGAWHQCTSPTSCSDFCQSGWVSHWSSYQTYQEA